MYTHQSRKFKHGYILTEQELRRIHELMLQQFVLAGKGDPKIVYQVRYKNGALAQPSSLDEVLSGENFGSNSVVSVGIRCISRRQVYRGVATDGTDQRAVDGLDGVGDYGADNCQNVEEEPEDEGMRRWLTDQVIIDLQFMSPADDDFPESAPIKLDVGGVDRDWVFLTISKLEERIQKVKVWNSARAFNKQSVIITFLPIICMTVLLIGLLFLGNHYVEGQRSAYEELRTVWQGGGIDAVDLLFKMRDIESRGLGSMPFWLLGATFPLFVGAIWASERLGGIVVALFPSFNYLWGDYVGDYERRKSRTRVVMGVLGGSVVLASAVGVFSNYLSGLLGVGR
jgi:hypothetical protein